MTFVPATDLARAPNLQATAEAGGVLHIAPGQAGCLLFGPHTPARAGLYRIAVKARVLSGGPAVFDAGGGGSLYAAR